MKSGVAAMTVMALRLAKISHRRAGMMLIFTAGEETTCVDAYAECKSLVWSLGNKEPKYDDD